MRIIVLLVCTSLLISSSCEEVIKEDPSSEVPVEEVGTRAIVTTEFADDGCAVLLEINEDGQKVLLMPIEIEEKFKVHGTELLIEFHFSRIMQSECQKGRPIVLEKSKLTD